MATFSSNLVLVTGASGFIGLNTVLGLLQQGFIVRATVRNDAAGQKVVNSLRGLADVEKLGFAIADLTKDEGWHDAARDCIYVIHTASPYPAVNPKDENELIIPAREGTLRVLRAAQDEGVKRVVLLSTIGAVFDGHEGKNKNFNESDWSDIVHPRLIYHKSKAIAERAAWDYINSPENKAGLEMVSINPTNVFGPVLDGHNFTSAEWFRTLMCAEVPGVPRSQIDLVDVRDLVDVLIMALSQPEAAGHRFILNAASIQLKEFANILHKNFSDRGYRVPTRVLPDFLMRLIALFQPKVGSIVKTIGWEYAISTEKAQAVFGWQPRSYEQTIIDMGESLIQHGVV